MEIIEKIAQISEAAKRQKIVVTDITLEGKVISDLPAFKRTYVLREEEAGEGEGNTQPTLDIEDEESKTKYDSKGAAAAGIFDALINGDYEEAEQAVQDYKKLAQSDTEGSDEDKDDDDDDDAEGDADLNGEASGTDHDYMMKAEESMEEDATVMGFLGGQKQGAAVRDNPDEDDRDVNKNQPDDDEDDEEEDGAVGGY